MNRLLRVILGVTLLSLLICGAASAADRIEQSTLNLIYGNSTLNNYTFNASTPIYANANSWLEMDVLTNSSSAVNYVQLERLLDWSTTTEYTAGSTPGGWYYYNGNTTNTGSLVVKGGVSPRWAVVPFTNSSGTYTSFYAPANGASTYSKTFFVPVGGWYRMRAVGWSSGDYSATYSANCTNGTLRIRKP